MYIKLSQQTSEYLKAILCYIIQFKQLLLTVVLLSIPETSESQKRLYLSLATGLVPLSSVKIDINATAI